MRIIALITLLLAFQVEAEPLNANLEGVYTLDLKCTQTFPGQPCEKDLLAQKVMVLDTGAGAGIVVSIHDGKFGYQTYQLGVLHISPDGNTIEGDGARFGHQAEFRLTFDPVAKTLSGWLSDFKSGSDYRVEGEQQFTTGVYYNSPVPLPVAVSELTGVYQEEKSGAKLVIKRRLIGGEPGDLVGSFNHPSFTLAFPYVEVVPWAGIVNLVRIETGRSITKWTLTVRLADDGAMVWSGKSLTANVGNTGTHDLKFTK